MPTSKYGFVSDEEQKAEEERQRPIARRKIAQRKGVAKKRYWEVLTDIVSEYAESDNPPSKVRVGQYSDLKLIIAGKTSVQLDVFEDKIAIYVQGSYPDNRIVYLCKTLKRECQLPVHLYCEFGGKSITDPYNKDF